MTARYLIDTDWAIHFLNRQERFRQRLEEHAAHGLGLSIISLAELYEGIAWSNNPERNTQGLHDFLEFVSVIGIDDSTCQIFGKERGRLRTMGKRLSDFDLLIGATALQHGLTLLTNNRRHFENIEGLRMESLP